jgi:hypothetical protein
VPDFFQRYIPDPRLFRGYRHILEAIDVYRAAKRPDIATRLEASLKAMVTEMGVQTAADAAAGTKMIRETLERRLVRPETSGPHLASRVRSEPIAAGSELPGGAVGFGDIQHLDAAVDPDYPHGGTYWRAIEWGSDAAVGRVVVGYFQPGFSIPQAGEFRNHPMFMSQGASGFLGGMSGAPAMRVQRPIEPKHFLRDGTHEAVTRHERQMERVQDEAISSMLAATATPRTR